MKRRRLFTRTRKWIPAFAGMTIKNEEKNHLPASGGALWGIIPPEDFFNTPQERAAPGSMPPQSLPP